jgi:hypothetical protein
MSYLKKPPQTDCHNTNKSPEPYTLILPVSPPTGQKKHHFPKNKNAARTIPGNHSYESNASLLHIHLTGVKLIFEGYARPKSNT